MSLDDERVRFYLRHREQIEQWAALRAEAANAIDDWLVELAPKVEELAASLGPDVRVRTQLVGTAYPAFRLVREAWGFGDAQEPAASISLEWQRGKTTLRGGGTPYVGLRSFKTTDIGGKLRASEAARRARAARKETTSDWWSGYAYVPPPPPTFPAEVEPYREVLVQALRSAWETYEPIVSALVDAPPSP